MYEVFKSVDVPHGTERCFLILRKKYQIEFMSFYLHPPPASGSFCVNRFSFLQPSASLLHLFLRFHRRSVFTFLLPVSITFPPLCSFHLSSLTSQTNTPAAETRTHLSSCWMQICNFFGKRVPGCWWFISHQDGSNLCELSVTNNQFPFRGLMSAPSSREEEEEGHCGSSPSVVVTVQYFKK